jgi:hypothetical protein
MSKNIQKGKKVGVPTKMVLLKLLKGIKHNPFTKLGDRPPAC